MSKMKPEDLDRIGVYIEIPKYLWEYVKSRKDGIYTRSNTQSIEQIIVEHKKEHGDNNE